MTLREALDRISALKADHGFVPEILDMEFTEQENDLKLDDASVIENARFCSLPEDDIAKMLAAAKQVRQDEGLSLIGKMIFRCVFLMEKAEPWGWLPLAKVMREEVGAFYLVVASGFVPLLKECHRKLGIPEEITRATCSQVRSYRDNHFTGTGLLGIYPQQLSWLHVYPDPEHFMVRLGRFEFRMMSHRHDGHVFRNKKTGELVIFAITGLSFDADGFAVESVPDSKEKAFVSVYSEDPENGTATGNRVDQYGRTSAEPESIVLADHDLILQKGMPVLDMHIPNGGGMTPAESENAFRMAKEFYFSRLPEDQRPAAIVCSSWIFNPNLPEMLNPDSNLVRLLQRVHPVPRNSNTTDGLWFIFRHEGAFELLKAPRKTSLQRAVTKFIENGGRWRIGGMVLPMDEIQI